MPKENAHQWKVNTLVALHPEVLNAGRNAARVAKWKSRWADAKIPFEDLEKDLGAICEKHPDVHINYLEQVLASALEKRIAAPKATPRQHARAQAEGEYYRKLQERRQWTLERIYKETAYDPREIWEDKEMQYAPISTLPDEYPEVADDEGKGAGDPEMGSGSLPLFR